MATHASVLAWEIPWTEKPAEDTVYAVAKGHDSVTKPPPPPPPPQEACRILVPWSGIEPTPPAVKGQVLNHWPPGSPNSSCLLHTLQFHPPLELLEFYTSMFSEGKKPYLLYLVPSRGPAWYHSHRLGWCWFPGKELRPSSHNSPSERCWHWGQAVWVTGTLKQVPTRSRVQRHWELIVLGRWVGGNPSGQAIQ